jgi:26S proteasome regulatory subunit T6
MYWNITSTHPTLANCLIAIS